MTPSNDFLDNLAAHQHEKMLREISNDELTPKKTDKVKESEIWDPATQKSILIED